MSKKTSARKASELSDLLDALDSIIETTNHQIPYYAYGDNEAACEMAARLANIRSELTYIKMNIEYMIERI